MKGLALRSLLVGLAMVVAIVGLPTVARADVTVQEGTPFTATVLYATCVASLPSINWGDGTANSTGTVGASGAIVGAHTYVLPGSYTGTVNYFCNQDVPRSTSFTATVFDAPLTLQAVALNGTAGSAISGVVAHLSDVNPLSQSSGFTATIDWGDGTSTVGAVATIAPGSYDVSASHTYASAGTYTVTTAITDPGGGTSATSTATIAAPAPDIVLPHTTITDGPNGGVFTWTTAPVFSFTSSIPGSTFECMIDSSPFAPCASGRFIGPLAPGPHGFYVRAVSPTGAVDSDPAFAFFYVGIPTTFTADGCSRRIPSYLLDRPPTSCQTVIGACPQLATCTVTGSVTMSDADGDGRDFPIEVASVRIPPMLTGAACGNNVYSPQAGFVFYKQYVTAHGCQTTYSDVVFGRGQNVEAVCSAFMSDVGYDYRGDPLKRRFTCAGHMTLAPTTPLAARLLSHRLTALAPSRGRFKVVLKLTARPSQPPTATKVPRPIVSRTIKVQQPGIVSVPFSLTGAERAELRRRGSLRLRLTEAFTPDSGITTTRVTQLTIRSAARAPTPQCPLARCPAVTHPGTA